MALFRKNKPNVTSSKYLPDVLFEDINNEDNEKQEELLAGIRQLSEPDRALIALFLDELSYQQISAILGISENNVEALCCSKCSAENTAYYRSCLLLRIHRLYQRRQTYVARSRRVVFNSPTLHVGSDLD